VGATGVASMTIAVARCAVSLYDIQNQSYGRR
jgi:hypothetical protein